MPPWLILLLLLSLSLALAYQLLSGRYGWRLLVYWCLIFLAVAACEAGAEAAGVNLTRFGDVRLGADFAGALAVLAALWRLHL